MPPQTPNATGNNITAKNTNASVDVLRETVNNNNLTGNSNQYNNSPSAMDRNGVHESVDNFGTPLSPTGYNTPNANDVRVLLTGKPAKRELDNHGLHNEFINYVKRILLTSIDYEEVENKNKTFSDDFLSHYTVLKSNRRSIESCNGNTDANSEDGSNRSTDSSYGKSSNNSFKRNSDSDPISAFNNSKRRYDSNSEGSSYSSCDRSPIPGASGSDIGYLDDKVAVLFNNNCSHQLPEPQFIIYSRENLCIGWENSGRDWVVGVGMRNFGNSCYINAVLQALFHIPCFVNWLMSDKEHFQYCNSNEDCIFCAMVLTLADCQIEHAPIDPYLIYSKLQSICKHFVYGKQEDAHEFLRFLIEAIDASYIAQFASFNDLDYYSRATTPINQIFGGYLKSSVQCLNCSYVSVTYQHFKDIVLDISECYNIYSALKFFFASERLDGENYKCHACKQSVGAKKQFTLEKHPVVLCFQFNRFSEHAKKLNKKIKLEPAIELSSFKSNSTINPPLWYKLVSVVSHWGDTQQSGHYTADGLTYSGEFYNFNDHEVAPISVDDVCNTDSYIIFYEMDMKSRAITISPVSEIGSKDFEQIRSHKNNGRNIINGTTHEHFPLDLEEEIGVVDLSTQANIFTGISEFITFHKQENEDANQFPTYDNTEQYKICEADQNANFGEINDEQEISAYKNNYEAVVKTKGKKNDAVVKMSSKTKHQLPAHSLRGFITICFKKDQLNKLTKSISDNHTHNTIPFYKYFKPRDPPDSETNCKTQFFQILHSRTLYQNTRNQIKSLIAAIKLSSIFTIYLYGTMIYYQKTINCLRMKKQLAAGKTEAMNLSKRLNQNQSVPIVVQKIRQWILTLRQQLIKYHLKLQEQLNTIHVSLISTDSLLPAIKKVILELQIKAKSIIFILTIITS